MSHWRRPATKTYDYNFKLGEHYYKPQLDYLDSRKGRSKTPPTAKTFAERFAEDPIYGRYGGTSRRTGLSDGLGGSDGLSNSARFGSLDDLNIKGSLFGEGANRQSGGFSPRLVVGDRLLDSVGVNESKLSSALNLNSSLTSSSKFQKQSEENVGQSSTSSRRKVGFLSAQADLVNEDPFKSQTSSKLIAARKQADDMMEEMKRDSDSSVSRFRARAQARKEEQSLRREQQSISSGDFGIGMSDDDETAALRTRVNEIGIRAKARLAQLEDDFPDIQIGSSLAARRAGTNASSSYANEDDNSSSQLASSRTVKISKRTVKASYELE